MAVYLLDINLLLAMSWPSHTQHDAAHQWFAALPSTDQWATCPMTQCGFVRISSNPKFTADALTPQDALELLERVVAQPGHIFWPDDLAMAESGHYPRRALKGYRQITDAYLFALSLAHSGA